MLDKIISLRTQWLADSREIIESPKVRANAILFSQNAGNIFRYNVMLGLIAWRKNIDPTPYFDAAVDDINIYCKNIIQIGAPPSLLPINIASILSSLIDRKFNFLSECKISNSADSYLDCLIAESVIGDIKPRSPQEGIEKLADLKRQSLAARTYEIYFDILNGDGGRGALDNLILSACKNYADRAIDKFYSGGQDINGGGKYNEIVVDFRLGAILKQIGFIGDSVHSWKW